MFVYFMARVLLLVIFPGVVYSSTVREPLHDNETIDPYSGFPVAFENSLAIGNNCYLAVENRSASIFQSMLELYEPNFVHFHLWFKDYGKVLSTKEAIMPFHWVWTYYSPNGFFPYLKWPVDFPILSFGLLDVKTQPQKGSIWLDIIVQGNCSLRMGDPATTEHLAYALRDMTETFLLNLNRKSYSFTYYCFLEEVPGVKQTVAYQFALYVDYPVEFAAYRCCRTDIPKYTKTKMFVGCMPHQIGKMFQVAKIPYILSIIAFIYFPIVFMGFSERLVSPGFYQRINQQRHTHDEMDEDWVYLSGKPPLSFTSMVAGFCGLANRHPVAVSRIRRFLFLLLCPCVVYIEVYVYNMYQHETTLALLDHDLPMGYLSMIGGYERSKTNFMPAFGGPFVMLAYFYVTCVLFLIIPRDVNSIMHEGSSITSTRQNLSPLLFGEELIENYSSVEIRNKFGYAKTVALGKGGVAMLVNPKFWFVVFKMQVQRFQAMYEKYLRATGYRVIACVLCLVFSVPLFLFCIIELSLCIVYYGMPIISFIFIASKGYAISLMNIFTPEESQRSLQRFSIWRNGINFRITRYLIKTVISCLFVMFVFSFCTIFIASFSFVSKLLVFSLVSVVVYPASAFGYLFFGAVLLYYVYKLLKGFGEGYSELLSDAVEISLHLEEDLALQATVFNGTIFLPRLQAAVDINQLNIHDTVIQLSADQRQQVQVALGSRVSRINERNQQVGVPRALFDVLVRRFRPVHIQVAKALLWFCLVLALMSITLSIFVVQPQTRTEGISEVMHVMFISIVGALPEVLGVILDRTDHATKKEIHLKRVRAAVLDYWTDVNRQNRV